MFYLYEYNNTGALHLTEIDTYVLRPLVTMN